MTEAPSLPGPPLAPEGPATPDRVLSWIKASDRTAEAEAVEVQMVTAAVNKVLRRWKPVPAEGVAWSDDVYLGAVMLAGRLWRRRNTPAGVETFAGDAVAYVQRNDPDVALLLELGQYAQPMAG